MLDFVVPPQCATYYTAENIRMILEHPHLLGHIMGYTKLTEMHSEWLWHLWGQPEGIHTSLQAHRGSFKTTIESQVGPVWWLLFHPDDRIGLLRETFTVAAETLDVIAKACQMEEIKKLFYAVQPDRGELKVLENPFGKLLLSCKRTMTKEKSIQAHGIDQLPTGTHFDRIQMDDVIVKADRYSKAKRERTKNSIREVLANIIDPGKTVMHTGTPWHKEDAWSMWCPGQDPNSTPVDPDEEDSSPLQPPLMYSIYDTGLLSEKQIRRIRKTTTGALFAANYELKHTADDDAIFRDPVFEAWQDQCGRVFCHVDCKYEGDHTMALTIAARRPDGLIQVYGKVYTESVKLKYKDILKTAHAFKARELHVETNPDKGWAAELFKRRDGVAGPPILVRPYAETVNKHVKIISHGLDYWDELIFDPNCDERYIAQIVDYREGQEPDDAPDSLVSLLRQAFVPRDPSRSRKNILNEY